MRRRGPRRMRALRHETQVVVTLEVTISEIEGVGDVPEVHVPRAVRHPDPREAVVRVPLLRVVRTVKRRKEGRKEGRRAKRRQRQYNEECE